MVILFEHMLRNINQRTMKIVEVRDCWVDQQLWNVTFSLIKDIINGYKNTLLRRSDENFEQ